MSVDVCGDDDAPGARVSLGVHSKSMGCLDSDCLWKAAMRRGVVRIERRLLDGITVVTAPFGDACAAGGRSRGEEASA